MDSFLEKLLYKKKYLGKVEKEGKVYSKYKKMRRFSLPRYSLVALVLLAAALLVALFFLCR